MKKLSALFALCGLAFVGAASAANITIYYSPSCPHCHHARDFISNNLVYEYPTITVTEVNVMDQANLSKFQETLKKCEYESGGVPVLTIGEKCFQGYADFMQAELREAVEADMSDADKAKAAENKKAMESDAEKFKSENAENKATVSEYVATVANAEQDADVQKKNPGSSSVWFWGLLIVLVAGLGIVLVRKDKK
ncbi:MAG: hypothetical protein IJ500_00185 [Alphaproteobacteria bacterium]|nr:hypothetical protein [Alphaproteobacteria bacterium]